MVHGKFIITKTNRIIALKLVGSFNEEGTTEFIEAMKKEIKKFGDSSFVKLFDISELEGGTPEAYEILDQYNKWLNQQNMLAKAMVIRTKIQTSIADIHTPARKKQNIQEFNDPELAKEWLSSFF